jgi:hypothetical protein
VQRAVEQDLVDRLKLTETEARRQHPEGNGMVLHPDPYLVKPRIQKPALSAIEPG